MAPAPTTDPFDQLTDEQLHLVARGLGFYGLRALDAAPRRELHKMTHRVGSRRWWYYWRTCLRTTWPLARHQSPLTFGLIERCVAPPVLCDGHIVAAQRCGDTAWTRLPDLASALQHELPHSLFEQAVGSIPPCIASGSTCGLGAAMEGGRNFSGCAVTEPVCGHGWVVTRTSKRSEDEEDRHVLTFRNRLGYGGRFSFRSYSIQQWAIGKMHVRVVERGKAGERVSIGVADETFLAIRTTDAGVAADSKVLLVHLPSDAECLRLLTKPHCAWGDARRVVRGGNALAGASREHTDGNAFTAIEVANNRSLRATDDAHQQSVLHIDDVGFDEGALVISTVAAVFQDRAFHHWNIRVYEQPRGYVTMVRARDGPCRFERTAVDRARHVFLLEVSMQPGFVSPWSVREHLHACRNMTKVLPKGDLVVVTPSGKGSYTHTDARYGALMLASRRTPPHNGAANFFMGDRGQQSHVSPSRHLSSDSYDSFASSRVYNVTVDRKLFLLTKPILVIGDALVKLANIGEDADMRRPLVADLPTCVLRRRRLQDMMDHFSTTASGVLVVEAKPQQGRAVVIVYSPPRQPGAAAPPTMQIGRLEHENLKPNERLTFIPPNALSCAGREVCAIATHAPTGAWRALRVESYDLCDAELITFQLRGAARGGDVDGSAFDTQPSALRRVWTES